MAHVAGCSNADRTGTASEPAPAPGTQPAADSAQAAGPAVDESAAASRAGADEAAAGAGVDRAHSSAGAALRPTPGAIRSDVLIVNDATLTADEVLYPLWDELAAARGELSGSALGAHAARLVHAQVQLEVGALLVYAQAIKTLPDSQKQRIQAAVDQELRATVAQRFGDSTARYEKHLSDRGLSLEAIKRRIERQLLVRAYTREMLLPRVVVRRDELLAHFREHASEYAEPETRELLMIAAPYAAFLDEGLAWEQADRPQRLRAKLAARRHMRAVQDELKVHPFREVAQRMSKGPRAAQGGSWGPIAEPLAPPYEQVSAVVFELGTGRVSELIETDRGLYLVSCGAIVPARRYSFMDVQGRIRAELTERRFEALASEYILGLAERATISDLAGFIEIATERALRGGPGRG